MGNASNSTAMHLSVESTIMENKYVRLPVMFKGMLTQRMQRLHRSVHLYHSGQPLHHQSLLVALRQQRVVQQLQVQLSPKSITLKPFRQCSQKRLDMHKHVTPQCWLQTVRQAMVQMHTGKYQTVYRKLAAMGTLTSLRQLLITAR